MINPKFSSHPLKMSSTSRLIFLKVLTSLLQFSVNNLIKKKIIRFLSSLNIKFFFLSLFSQSGFSLFSISLSFSFSFSPISNTSLLLSFFPFFSFLFLLSSASLLPLFLSFLAFLGCCSWHFWVKVEEAVVAGGWWLFLWMVEIKLGLRSS